jgi:A/G-specific adenine glycosylase
MQHAAATLPGATGNPAEARAPDIVKDSCEDDHDRGSMSPELTDAVSRWYADAARDLPWRRPDATPWAVLVSEVMLQQTPVVRVLPAYAAWLARWPTPPALADDSAGDAVRMWAKLGYPRRALRLHECAVAITTRFGGDVPPSVPDLESLPGIGAYTARAVATFAFGQRHPVVDTNVRRVVARAVLGQGDAGPPSAKRDHDAVEALLPGPPAAAARASVALMELGALLCTARAPRCEQCPLERSCAWKTAGRPEYGGPTVRPQRFAGTDRQVRGLLMDVLRATDRPVDRTALDVVWHDAKQRKRALESLITDGLVTQTADGEYGLPA